MSHSTRRDLALANPTDKLMEIHEVHDIRDQTTSLKAREKEIVDRIIEHYGESVVLGRALDIGVARITRRRGRETVDIGLLRDKLGEDAESFITHYKEAIVLSHIDPYAIDDILRIRENS